ncbi:WYL domain-containing protein [Methylomicrobium sp. Wu6]|uniref:helix-turn-helix transcriptional regulator n=1 Tax=Methylomicrobium sp. Wu6 TaxID=3107928 RepID=UPI002DD629A8|nr:WYL domain-containing protein [Methylomicrobium sp. Wu6]MEC4748246.1 WYL domain-containing protein [Methylomicrobium sp. Wu6]
MSANYDHDTLVIRLAQILIRLNEGQALDPKALADEFQVHPRTIQRDLNERFAYLPLKKDGNVYRLENYYLGKLMTSDIRQFAAIAGIKGLFPSLDNGFLKSILDVAVSQAYLVKGHRYEDTKNFDYLFSPLETAILKHHQITFTFSGKPRRHVAPYRLLNHKGIWYLAAVDDDKLKSFRLSGISDFASSEQTFIPDAAIQQRVADEDSIWFTSSKREVVLKIDAPIAHYFQRRQVLPNQQIDKTLENGSLIVSTLIGHEMQVLPIVRYWIPHIRIISPEDLRQGVNQSLSEYLQREGTLSANKANSI